ncbi:peptidoglycan-binding domain 1 protein [Tolypothrix sp. NIES-4075]|uniref:peptidoglycan-binding domain-containing protein n=1 Tax=Tolypothrix sp. NIES-4075 TaxID=2005459 RepID=UPI000B5D042D|nr:peptidoglycan-binding domain-containing protein [Tolypothrix sp. NIES-4075]GAX42482.1 peptidoglycan-binding domain 1 protein [Tolypothrix sp. NIES-4075]
MIHEVQATATKELPVLQKGDTGNAVKLLQNLLIFLGYFDKDLRTGNFLEQTEQAVKNFQSEYNLQVDGIVGAKTWDLLGGVLWD